MNDESVEQSKRADEELREKLQPGEKFAPTPADVLSMEEMRSDWVSRESNTARIEPIMLLTKLPRCFNESIH
jgi:hypothetical protein